MIFKDDIISQVNSDFGTQAALAIKVLENAITKTAYLKTDRIIRCVIFLSEGNLEQLKSNIQVAVYDPRDVMFWAEYENKEGSNPKRIRDFNRSFKDNFDNIKE